MKKNNPETSCGRCALHVRAIIRNPSRFAFYAGGIIREFKEASPFALVFGAGCSPFFGLCLIKYFFQH
jgi:hypothetical protein